MSTALAPLCFVLMPYGLKRAADGAMINFDVVYRDLIAPAVRDAGLEPLRADEEQAGGIIHKPMFERLVLCEYAVADLTTANANVLYELGVRHGTKPASTVLMFGAGSALPFDVSPLRGLPYSLGPDGAPNQLESDRAALTLRLHKARDGGADSPVFQLLDGFPDLKRLKTDIFRDRVEYSRRTRERLQSARKLGAEAVTAIAAEVAAGPSGLADVDAGVVIDIFLSYRAVRAWEEMIALVPRMSAPLAAVPMVQEQLALAMNRAGRPDEAESILLAVIAAHGPSSETCGLLGRVYKDRWEAAVVEGDVMLARGWLQRAIDTYLQGFQADWRDAYPGVNAVTLMELQDPPDPRREKLTTVVQYAVDRRIGTGTPDYWDHATRLELAVLAADKDQAARALADALAAIREVWEPESTARNLRLIREARERRGTSEAWAREIEDELNRRAASAT